MFTQYFAQYLLNKGYIKKEQLREGLEFQKETRLKLGVLAINAGYMTAVDADEVNEAQRKYDKKFGELAIEMEYLNEEQVQELLSSQKYGHLLLGQILIEKGYMTLQDFEKAINEYKKDYCISEEDFEALQSDDVDEIVSRFFEFDGCKNEKALKGYLALLVRILIRFIDTEAVIRKVVKVDDYMGNISAKQDIIGEIALNTFIEADEDTFIKFASKYAEEELTVVDEMVRDSVGEFLNLQNGIFTVNISNMGIELELSPQEIYKNINVHDAYVAYIDLSFGQIRVIIKEE